MKEKVFSLALPLTLKELTRVLVFISLSLLSFFIPFSLGHPQWLVGTIVNTCLFLTAVYLPKRYYIPLIILPSLGVLARGLLFGPFTLFLVYFLPFIWLGNFILILIFKNSFLRFNYLLSVFLAATTKFLLLIITANIYFNFHLVPSIFVQTMGLNQLATALAGGLISWVIYEQYNSRNKKTA